MFPDQRICRYHPIRGRLLIDLRSCPEFACEYLSIGAWRRGLRVRLRMGGAWVERRDFPDLVLIRAGMETPPHRQAGQPTHPVARFVRGIPADVRRLLQPFAYNQLPLLSLLRRHPEARVLLEERPLLLWLAALPALRKGGGAAIQGFLSLKPTAILAEAVGQGAPQALRLLERLRNMCFERSDYLALRQVLADEPLVRTLYRVQDIDWCAVRYLTRRRRLLACPAVHGLLRGGDSSRLMSRLRDLDRTMQGILDMGTRLGLADLETLLATAPDEKALPRLHDSLAGRLRQAASTGNVPLFLTRELSATAFLPPDWERQTDASSPTAREPADAW